MVALTAAWWAAYWVDESAGMSASEAVDSTVVPLVDDSADLKVVWMAVDSVDWTVVLMVDLKAARMAVDSAVHLVARTAVSMVDLLACRLVAKTAESWAARLDIPTAESWAARLDIPTADSRVDRSAPRSAAYWGLVTAAWSAVMRVEQSSVDRLVV